MSHFVASNCKLDQNTIVNKVAWSYMDSIACLGTIAVDEKNRKIHRVQFMNSEVRLYLYMYQFGFVFPR